MSAAVHIDLTELIRSPIRTGIQRVERELISHWPATSQLIPVLATSSGFCVLRPSALTACLEGKRPSQLIPSSSFPSHGARLINPELFTDPKRSANYLALIQDGRSAVGWLVHDFLPCLRPQDFQPGAGIGIMPYLRALAAVPNVAFVSKQTRRDYEERIMHGHGRHGPVISLGYDGLGITHQQFTPARRHYLALGTIERRKNLVAVLEAFAGLWANGYEAELTIIGRLLDSGDREAEWLERLRNEPRLHYLGHADDKTLREALATTRAIISVSKQEGFGLVPVEALHAGIPVIVWPQIPSIVDLPSTGQIRLAAPTATAIAEAVRSLQDNAAAARLWQEAASFPSRLWSDFARDIAAWAEAMPLPGARE